MTILTFIFRSLEGRCHGNQSLGRIGKIAIYLWATFIHHTGIPQRIGCANHGDDLAATSGRNLVPSSNSGVYEVRYVYRPIRHLSAGVSDYILGLV